MALDLSLLDGGASVPVAVSGLALLAPLAAFEEDPDNPRFEDEGPEFEQFVGDVRRRGILQPVVVRRMATGMLRLRFGRRRYRAACRLALPTLPYVVTEDTRQFDDYAQVAENEQRKPLQPLELATFIARKLAQGESKKTVAAQLAMDASALTHLLALVQEPPPPLLELYHSRRCRSPQYLYQLAKLYRREPVLVEQALVTAPAIDHPFLAALHTRVRHAGAGPASDVAPEAARQPPAAVDVTSDCLRHPALHGLYQGRRLTVQLHRRPTAAGRLWVCFDGGQEQAEVPIAQVRLTGLDEGMKQARGER